MLETAAKIGLSLSVAQIFLFVVLGQFLSKLWILINELQLIAYVGMWSINYSI